MSASAQPFNSAMSVAINLCASLTHGNTLTFVSVDLFGSAGAADPNDNLDVTQPDPTKMENVEGKQSEQILGTRPAHKASLTNIYALFAVFLLIMVFIGVRTKRSSSTVAEKSIA